jgi:sulfhydrogenase subunit gamma (sulfur reductase)
MKELSLKPKDEKLYLPEPAEIIDLVQFNKTDKFFRFRFLSGRNLGHVPGQFVQVSVLGIGEAPISICSPPAKGDQFELCLRAVGEVTNKLHTLKKGDVVQIRGPFGHGYTPERMAKLKGKHLLIIAGGMGYAPLRSLINKVVYEKENYHKISILYGCRSAGDRTFMEEVEKISKMGGNVEVLETVDRECSEWQKNVGVITTLIPKVSLDPQNTIACVVGPPIMFKFVLMALNEKKIPKENIFVSLERRMKCGVGKCGHCQMEGIYVCQEGPVFNYAEVKDNEEVF